MVKEKISESIEVKQKMVKSELLCQITETVQQLLTDAFRKGKKVWFCGNGGSAADAQHLAAELSGRFYIDRPALDAEALHCNSSYMTAVANDYTFDDVYARLVRSLGKEGDVLIPISTSGNSENIVRAAKEAQGLRMVVIGLTGASGGRLKAYCNYCFQVPSNNTPRIQEAHILLGHIICEQVEKNLFTKF